MKKNLDQAEDGLKSIQKDINDLTAVASKWTNDAYQKQLLNLNQSKQYITQNYVRLREDFQNSQFLDVKKVSSKNQKEYDAFNKEQQDFSGRFKTLENQFKHYEDSRNKMTDYLAKKKIYKVDVKQVNKDFVEALSEAKKSQLKVKDELMDYSVKVNQSTLSDADKKVKREKVQELVKMVEVMENETFKLQRLHTATIKEIGSGVKFVTPGMKAHDYIGKIQNHTKIINDQIDKFNKSAKEI